MESELAHTFGRRPELDFLAAPEALGDKIRRLRALNDGLKAKLRSRGVKIGSLNYLAKKLSALNNLRTSLQVAHGTTEFIEANEGDAKYSGS